MAHHNWHDAKRTYVEGTEQPDGTRVWQSLEQVGLLYAISDSSIRKRAARSAEDWGTQRDIYRTKIAQAKQAKRIDVLAARGAEFDGKALRAAEQVLDQVLLRMLQAGQGNKLVAAAELQRLAACIRTAHVAGRLAMGDTTEIVKQVDTLTREFDLSTLTDEELAKLDELRAKMHGTAPDVRH